MASRQSANKMKTTNANMNRTKTLNKERTERNQDQNAQNAKKRKRRTAPGKNALHHLQEARLTPYCTVARSKALLHLIDTETTHNTRANEPASHIAMNSTAKHAISPKKFQAAPNPTETLVSLAYLDMGVSHVVKFPALAKRYPRHPAAAIAAKGKGKLKAAEAGGQGNRRQGGVGGGRWLT